LVHQELLVDIETGEHVHLTDPFLLSPVDVKAVNTIIWNVIERILAFIGLGLTLPLLGLIGALLWLTEGSSPLTSVERVGRKPNPWATGGATEPQVIRLYHLRTRRADGTYTWLGAWLEATELSRLPELWHVVRSELGLVGVKSLPPETAERIVEPWQRKRYDYQAGFTGLWYTETLPHADFDEQCIVDAYHAAIHNWRNALQCLWRTPGAWWRRMGNSRHGQSVAPKRTPKRVPKRLRKEFARFVQLNLGESTSRDSAWQ
jgi:lipopolysaccharide/colanic/teichoic acid biosynthesis glycosyltransferase